MAEEFEEAGGSLETEKDAGKGKEGLVRRWCMAIDLAGREEKKWRERAEKVMQRYRQEEKAEDPFAILWSNTEVMAPALYNSTPTPEVRRTFKDEDPAGKDAAESLQRALTASLEGYDFDHVMTLGVLDLLLPGRTVTRVRYEPTLEQVQPEPYVAEPIGFDPLGNPIYDPEDQDEDGNPRIIREEPYDQIVDQATYCEPVHWDDFRRGPGGNWDEVEWIAFRHKLTRKQLTDRFRALGEKVNLDYMPKDIDEDQLDEPEIFKRGIVWEVWDKKKREVLFIAPSVKEKPLKVADDPLELHGFFPIPRPMYAVQSTTTLVPVELFKYYKTEADELNRVTRRINRLIEGLKVRGVYDSTVAVMQELMQADDNTMLPTSDASLQLLQTGGSLDRAIWMMPIDKIAMVLRELYVQRQTVIETIYEITGISDIMRGQTDPRETKGAQQIKAQTGSRRMRRLQREVQRYARDLLRIKAEIIGEKFEPQIISMMINKEVSPEAMEILRSDQLRQFRVDIETDSTISDDEMQDRESLMNLLSATGQYIANIGPAVQQGFVTPEAAKSLFESVIRHFRLGRKIEDALEESERQAQEGQQEPQKSPEQIQAEAEAQRRGEELQADLKRRDAESEAEIKRKEEESRAEIRRKRWETEQRILIEREKAAGQLEVQGMKARNTAA